jgi:hypothetical protein
VRIGAKGEGMGCGTVGRRPGRVRRAGGQIERVYSRGEEHRCMAGSGKEATASCAGVTVR